MPFNFQDVVLAEGTIQDRRDRKWSLKIDCGPQSSIKHGTFTQQNEIGRQDPHDSQSGIRTSDDLLALQLALLEANEKISNKLIELGLGEPPAVAALRRKILERNLD